MLMVKLTDPKEFPKEKILSYDCSLSTHFSQTYMPSVHASRGSLHTSLPTHTGLSTRGGQEGEAFLLKWGIISLGYHSFCLLHVGPGQGSTRSEPGGFLSHVTYFSGALLPDLGILIPTLPQQGSSVKSSPTVLPTFLEILSPLKTQPQLPQELSNHSNVPYLPVCCVLYTHKARLATRNFNHHTRSQNNIPFIIST